MANEIVKYDPIFAGSQVLASGWGQPSSRFAFGNKFRNAVGGVTRNVSGFGRGVNRGILKRAVPIAGAGALLGIVDAASELNDPLESGGRNMSQAGGRLGGNLLGGASGALLGTVLGGPVGALIGGGLGASLGGGAGSAVGGGLHQWLTGERGLTPEERLRDQALKDNRLASQIAYENRLLRDAADRRQAELNLGLQNDYNFANTLNQQALNAQQARDLQYLIAQSQY